MHCSAIFVIKWPGVWGRFWTFCSVPFDCSSIPDQHHNVFIINVASNQSWYMVVCFPALLFFLQRAWAFLGFLQFSMNFRTGLLISTPKIHWDFDVACIESVDQFGGELTSLNCWLSQAISVVTFLFIWVIFFQKYSIVFCGEVFCIFH